MNTISMEFGDVTKKQIITPNDFVSHMIEHIAWRMCCSIDLRWDNENWRELGKTLGSNIKAFQSLQEDSAALGMIDDGSAEVSVETGKPEVRFQAFAGIDLPRFLRLRCEQIPNGSLLMELLEGISEGIGVRIAVLLGNLEDPHHTWEGVFRALGIALGRMYTPRELCNQKRIEIQDDVSAVPKGPPGEIEVLERSLNRASVRRGTAESGVTVTIDFTGKQPNSWKIDVADSIRAATKDIPRLFVEFCNNGGFTMQVQFRATVLSSSHVVFEDVGMVAGRALLEILKLRMEKYGVNGAGSTVKTPNDVKTNSVNVAVSVEGRKCWRFISSDGNNKAVIEKFLIGQNVLETLRSEDIDDFIDGLAGGMTTSIMVHLKEYSEPDRTWQKVLAGLGSALKEVFEANPYRRGVPPGVKATLA